MGNQAEAIKNRMNVDDKSAAGSSAAANNALPTTKPVKTSKTFDEWMTEMSKPLSEALPAGLTAERFKRMVITNYKATPALRDCTMESVLGAALQAAQLGLMIGTLDQAYLVPYSNYKGKDDRGKSIFIKEAQLQIGYKGYMDLGYRTNKVSKIDTGMVYDSDDFDFQYGSEEFIRHRPKGLEKDTDLPVWYYVKVHMKDGSIKFLVKSYQQIIRHAKKHTNMYEDGQPNKKSNWIKNFDSMAIKTVIRELFKTMPLTTDFMLALQTDGSIKHVNESNISVNMAEDIIDVTDYSHIEEESKAAAADPKTDKGDDLEDDFPPIPPETW